MPCPFVAYAQRVCKVLRLRYPGGQRLVPGFSFHDRELDVSVNEDVVGLMRLGTATVAFETTGRDSILAPYAAVLDDAPARGCERRVNVFRAGLGFVHEKGVVASSGMSLHCGLALLAPILGHQASVDPGC